MTTAAQPARTGHGSLLGLALVVIAASTLASWVQSSFGAVDVRGITLPTQNGQWVAADLFKPRSATADDPAPLVVVVPGFQRSKETLSNISIELSRRGLVVIAIDPYAQGDSSSSTSARSATEEGYGMFAVVDYAHDTPNLDYVDKTRIAATGHSAGGNAAIRGAAHFGRLARRRAPSKLHSVFVSGYVLSLTDSVLRHVRSNVGISYALYDEGAYRNELASGDMRRAPEALRLVNSARADGEPALDEVEIGRGYGDVAARTFRIVHNEPLLHPFQPYSPEATANQIAYFETVFGLEPGFPPTDQIWYWKELLTLISLVAAMLMLVPLARLLIETPYFRPLAHPVPAPLPRPQGAGAAVFWGVFALSALIACFTYIPMARLSQELFVAASTREQTWFFPQRMNNAVMLWALLNGTVGFALFFLTYRLFGKAHGVRPEHWGVRTSPRELARAGVLAVTIFACFFGFLFAIYEVLHVDYRFVFMGVRKFRPALVPLLAMYAPVFFVFFLSNSLRANGGMRFAGQPEWRSLVVAGIANSLGLMLIVAVQYSVFAATGTVYWTDGWLYVNLLFAVVPMMFLLPWFHRYFFRLTGRIWLGPMTTCLIFIMILLSNTVCYLPL